MTRRQLPLETVKSFIGHSYGALENGAVVVVRPFETKSGQPCPLRITMASFWQTERLLAELSDLSKGDEYDVEVDHAAATVAAA